MKLLIINSNNFYEMLKDPLERLKKKKSEEFGNLELTHKTPLTDEKPNKFLNSELLENTFLCFCSNNDYWKVATYLKNNKYKIPLFVMLESYDTDNIDEIYQNPYLYTRGFFHESTLDPEEVGHIIKVVKSSYRRHQEKLGNQSKKKIGWKVQRNNDGKSSTAMVSLFLDPAMREFMQRLLFVVESVNVPFSEEEAKEKNFNAFREIFDKIDNEYNEDEKFRYKNDEEEAKKLLAKKEVIVKPQPILLEGETGVGKTLIARKIHQLLSKYQNREDLPFQQISTVNISGNIVESELFGTITGAWTGSVTRIGKLLMGWGGVVFLDEIGDLPPEIQAKFLVYLDTFEFEPDGWHYGWKIYSPAFIIAATNKDLKAAVEKGEFRRDLYHRFTHKLTVPPLRERRYDIRALIDFVLQSPEINRNGWIEEISLSALARLEEHPFPGNFRELEAVLSKAIFRARQDGRNILFEEDLEF